MNQPLNKTETDIEELRSAIYSYKQTIKQAETKKITHYNKMYQQKVQKKLYFREEHRLAYTNSLILPGLNTINLYNFYEDLRKISKVYEITLNIIPTLFLPFPVSFFFTNSQGTIQLSETEDSFIKFFDYFDDKNKENDFPAFVLKRPNKKMIFFWSGFEAKNYLMNKSNVFGILQTFVGSGKLSILKILYRYPNFKYVLVSKFRKIKTIGSYSLQKNIGNYDDFTLKNQGIERFDQVKDGKKYLDIDRKNLF